jgi:hypothetical protein
MISAPKANHPKELADVTPFTRSLSDLFATKGLASRGNGRPTGSIREICTRMDVRTETSVRMFRGDARGRCALPERGARPMH